MSNISVYLEEWMKEKRESWQKYDYYIKKYNESQDLLSKIPSADRFIRDILVILKDTTNEHPVSESNLEKIFSQKSERSWEGGKNRDERISSGTDDYIDILKQQIGITPNEADAVRKYLTELNDNVLKLLSIPSSIRATYGLQYKILNGNKYVKLLRVLDQIRRNDTEELKKYQNYTDNDLKSDTTLYGNHYRFYRLSVPLLEMYSIANLHLESVYIYNSRIVLKEFGYEYKDPYNFKDLFDLFPVYERFVSEKYRSFAIYKRQNLRDMLPSSLTDDQKSVILKHVEVDQFFRSYKKIKKNKHISPNVLPTGNLPGVLGTLQRTYAGVPRNMILHGPVGTGKTYLARKLANFIVSGQITEMAEIEKLLDGNFETQKKEISIVEDGSIRMVTFHQSYGYEEFIGGIRASTEKNTIKYSVEEGIFMKLCNEARNNIERPYVILIDEINRGDISRIFGELITLIEEDKRYKNDSDPGLSLTIPNFDKKFSVPENVFIIGTMNDSDRSIALLDVALRRRFTFFNVPPNPKMLEDWIDDESDIKQSVIEVFKALNSRIEKIKGKDSQIGHAFFKSLKDADYPVKELLWIFKYKILPLLREMFYGQDDTLSKKILNGHFLEKAPESSVYMLNKDLLDPEDIGTFFEEFEMLRD